MRCMAKFLSAILLCVSALPTYSLGESDALQVVAEVGGIKITAADLDKAESSKLLQARYDYYQAQSKALNDLIDKTLLEQAAKSAGLTVEQLLEREVKSKVKDPSEEQLKVFYEGLESDQPYEAMRPKIIDRIRQIRTDRARAAFMASLREGQNITISLAPPSADVNLVAANTVGSKDAPVVLVEFADYECPYCQKVAGDLLKLQKDFAGKISFTYKDFPLPMHAHAEKAAEAARCAGEQGMFWQYHDELFRTKEIAPEQLKTHAVDLKLDTEKFSQCVDSGAEAAAVQKDRTEGNKLGLSGTPSFFVNGHFYSGALDYAALHQIIEQQLAEKEKPVAVTAAK